MLIDTYKKIFKNKKKWCYYSDFSFTDFPLKSNYLANRFIINYIEHSKKDNLLLNFESEGIKREIHTLSLFLLGFDIKKFLNIKNKNFKYIWFLTCLYHDFAYIIEENKVVYDINQDLKKIKNKLAVENNLLECINDKIYNNELITKYFDYCRKISDYKFLNHGIIGGILLYDSLIKNFEECKKEAKLECENKNLIFNENDFIYNKLRWSERDKEIYLNISFAILKHNIWFATTDYEKNIYYEYDLDKLVINEDNKIKFKNDKLLFLLILSDSIEPTKHFNTTNYKCVLEKIDFRLHKAQKKIEIDCLDNCLDYKPWFNKIKGFESWLGIKVENEQNSNILTIEIL